MTPLNPSNPRLIVFLVGSFSEQKQEINREFLSLDDLNYIWQHLSKNPQAQDSSKVYAYQLHRELLKQPQLPEKVVWELWGIYHSEISVNLRMDILSHPNFPKNQALSLMAEFIKLEKYNYLSWLLESKNVDLVTQIVNFLTDPTQASTLERFKYLKHLKRQSSSEISEINTCLKTMVKHSSHKLFLNNFYFWLQRENFLDDEWKICFLKNSNSNTKIIKNIYQNKKTLPDEGLVLLLLHSNNSKDLTKNLILELKHKSSQTIFFQGFKQLLTQKELSEELMEVVFQTQGHHLEILNILIKHPQFNRQLLWRWYLNPPLFNSLSEEIKKLIKKELNF